MADPTPAYLFGRYLADFVAGLLPLIALYYAVKTVHEGRWYGALWAIGAVLGVLFFISDISAFLTVWTLSTFFQLAGLLTSIGWLYRRRQDVRHVVEIVNHSTSQ